MQLNPIRAFLLVTGLLAVTVVVAQKPTKMEKRQHKYAYGMLEIGDYEEAIKEYTKLIDMAPKTSLYHFELGIAYLRSPKDVEKAEGAFKNAERFSGPDTIKELKYYLGKALQANHKFDEAQEAFKEFAPKIKKKSKAGQVLSSEVDWSVKQCQHGIYHVNLNTKNPLENKEKPLNNVKKYFLSATDYVVMQNLGDRINSINDEESVIFLNNEEEIYFTSRRNPFGDAQKLYIDDKPFEQIYVSKLKSGEWAVPYLLNSANIFPQAFSDPSSHVSIVSVDQSEKTLLLYKNGKLFISQLQGKTWTFPEELPAHINAKKSKQSTAFLSPDGSALIISSDRKGGYGGLDLYVSEKGADGTWGELQNLGAVVNTEQDEDCPYLTPADELYFSSKGHSSIGGYDVFMSKYKDGKWATPKSLGIPINTPGDEVSYIRSKRNPTVSYYASSRMDGFGYKDIYRVTSYFKERQMDTLPGVVMGGLLTDQWTEEQRDSIRKAQEAIAVVQQPEKVEPETSAPVIVEPVKEEPVKEEPVKKEPVKTETVKAEPTKPAKKEDWDSDLEDLFADLRFGFNETNLSAENQTRLNRVANWMKEHPNAVVNLDGHADYLGTDEVNDVVAEQRALLVWNYLAKNGVDPYQVLYTSQGERKPKVPGQNADGSDNPGNRAINRRVEMDLEQHLMFRVFNFAYSSKEVNAEGLKKIQEVAAFMKANPASKARLSGFTDPGGNPAFNKELSRKRVEAAAQKLKELGIAEGRIQTEYFGQEKPTAPNTSEEYRSLNRRVEIRVD